MYYLIGIFFNEPIVYTALFWLIDQWNVDSFLEKKKGKSATCAVKIIYHTYIPIPSIHEIDNFCYYVKQKQKQNKKNEFVILN